jgi:hypothetical protein
MRSKDVVRALDVAALLKAFFPAQGQHVGQRRDVANTVDLQECLCRRILCLADLLDLSIRTA